MCVCVRVRESEREVGCVRERASARERDSQRQIQPGRLFSCRSDLPFAILRFLEDLTELLRTRDGGRANVAYINE